MTIPKISRPCIFGAPLSRRPYVHPVYGECYTRSPKSMPVVFSELAAYNSRVVQGIVHSPDYVEAMKALQVEYTMWSADVDA